MFNYISSGGLHLANCAGPNKLVRNVLTKYDVRDVVYTKHHAQKGKLKDIFIKKINIINVLDYNYQDQTNRIWLEDELLTLEEAQEIVATYKQRVSEAYFHSLENCTTTFNT